MSSGPTGADYSGPHQIDNTDLTADEVSRFHLMQTGMEG